MVFPVATNSEPPIAATPDTAQIPPPCWRTRSPGVESNDPAGVVSAIPEVPAVGNVKGAIHEGERAALILDARVETRDCGLDIDGRLGSAPVRQREREDAVARAGSHRGNEDQPAPGVDDGSAGDAERIDVAAGELGPRGGSGERPRPDPRAGQRIERDHLVVLGGDEQQVLSTLAPVPVQRLGIDGASERGGEGRILTEPRCCGAGQRWIDVHAAARRVVVVL